MFFFNVKLYKLFELNILSSFWSQPVKGSSEGESGVYSEKQPLGWCSGQGET